MIFSSDDLPAQLNDRARFNLWHEIFNAEIVDAQFSMAEDVPFSATFRAIDIGRLNFSHTMGTIKGAGRTASQAAPDEYYTLYINTCASPTGGVHGAREVEVASGGALVNASQAQAMTGGDHNSWILIRVPMGLLDARFPGLADRQDQVIEPGSEALRFLRRYVGLLDTEDVPTLPGLVDHMTATIIDLTGLAIGASGDEAARAGLRGLRRARLNAVLDHIRLGYRQPDMSAKIVGGKLGLSARYVQDLLAATGSTFSERVLELRLQKSQEMLGAAQCSGMRISEIIYACGFNDISYFNRCFRRRFGCSPGAAR